MLTSEIWEHNQLKFCQQTASCLFFIRQTVVGKHRVDLWRFRFKVGVHSLLTKTYSPFDYIYVVCFDFFPKGTTTVVHKNGYQRKKLIVEHIFQDKQPRFESQSHSMVLPQDMFHSSVYRCSHSTL